MNISTNSGSATFYNSDYYDDVLSFTHTGVTIEVVKRRKSQMMYTTNPPKPMPDSVWKEIYSVVDGKLKLTSRIQGEHQPAYQVSEKFTFNETK